MVSPFHSTLMGQAYVLKYSVRRTIAFHHVQVLGAAYSVHSTLREARLCYLRALVGNKVFFIQDDGLSESKVTASIPLGCDLESWWSLCWKEYDGNNDISVPTIRP